MVGFVLPGLKEEEQIAGASGAHVARDEERVVVQKRRRVRKLREGAALEIAGRERPGAGAKEIRTQRPVRISEFAQIAESLEAVEKRSKSQKG